MQRPSKPTASWCGALWQHSEHCRKQRRQRLALHLQQQQGQQQGLLLLQQQRVLPADVPQGPTAASLQGAGLAVLAPPGAHLKGQLPRRSVLHSSRARARKCCCRCCPQALQVHPQVGARQQRRRRGEQAVTAEVAPPVWLGLACRRAARRELHQQQRLERLLRQVQHQSRLLVVSTHAAAAATARGVQQQTQQQSSRTWWHRGRQPQQWKQQQQPHQHR
jgi:hypothetical protein